MSVKPKVFVTRRIPDAGLKLIQEACAAEVARRGGTCGAVLNAANEAAVTRFLDGDLSFLDIPRVCRAVLEHHHYSPRPTLTELGELDRWARQETLRWKTATTCSVMG